MFGRGSGKTMRVFIENEAGSRQKHIWDERTLERLRSVEISAPYPFPYGFVPGTVSDDGAAVDCFVLTKAPLAAGAMVDCEPVALLEQIEDGAIDHKVLAVPRGEEPLLDPAAVARVRAFIAAVFAHVPGKRMQLGRLRDRAAAEAHLRQCWDRDLGPNL
jgi:inorganic pyrophosphatase